LALGLVCAMVLSYVRHGSRKGQSTAMGPKHEVTAILRRDQLISQK
jgi:hypothetical protein